MEHGKGMTDGHLSGRTRHLFRPVGYAGYPTPVTEKQNVDGEHKKPIGALKWCDQSMAGEISHKDYSDWINATSRQR